MKFEYTDFDTVNDEHGRWYMTPEGPLPSITTVLGGTESAEKRASLEAWRNSLGHEKAAQVSKDATDRGTLVHLLVERYLKGEDVFAEIDGMPVAQAGIASFNCLKMAYLKKITSVWGQEQAVYSSVLKIAGRFDCVGEYEGVPSVIDFKTAGRVKKEDDISEYKLQLAFYASAHNELYGTDIQQGIILMAAGTAFPLMFRVPICDSLVMEVHDRSEKFWQQVLGGA